MGEVSEAADSKLGRNVAIKLLPEAVTTIPTALPPGVYQLFACESIPDTARLNPEFIPRWEGRGQVVSMDAGGSVSVRARLFSKGD